ncbi:similar to Saccharomyces cerevisiae YHR133C NSG1 Protein involved in regulation of sterol biosynthesis [Maudiozyma saulgeensis]|uniref:Similar to Saccharomyces cerevisiae YHR133C NSG1 Protein involved in regulation of sterol biosynthesis n=1 Tax=Maudiozyma saulgeensis TaxID=1789683 RepID=A0A1X7R646_9SACH|nr:similar to Saccharomyces cerevisiae YHR133C NSG1 Protein involved in regulation of sterol biosynthesis [Kazachstania saulgeensis]
MSRPANLKSEDSVSNLVKPTLYSIYDKDITSSSTDYSALKHIKNAERANTTKERSFYEQLITIVYATIILFIFGNIFAALSNELYDNLTLKRGMLSITLHSIASYINDNIVIIDKSVVFGIMGILCGFVIPICDNVFFSKYNYNMNSSNDFQSILKCLNSILGISLGIKHLRWKSSIQASSSWGLLNIIMWLYFDGSLSTLTVGSIISFVSCIISFNTITNDNYSLLLYIMDFYFFSLLIFGKIGRYLLRNY